MQDTHDERRIALELEPQPASLLESIRHWLMRGRARRQAREDSARTARIANAPLRAYEARRRARQPGTETADTPESVTRKGLAMLSRLGRGGL